MSAAAANLPLVALAAGGTGGHVFPAQALAEALARRGHPLAFVTDRRGRAIEAAGAEIALHRISAEAVFGTGMLGRVRGLISMVRGMFEASRLLGAMKPGVVVGFGGYASVPTLWAAARRGIATVIHEQNAVLGRANRLLAPRARGIALSFEDTRHLRPADAPRAVVTGNPVRPAIAAAATGYPAPAADGRFRLFVFGGSQGARVFSEVVPAALARLSAERRDRLALTQQCRPEDLDRARLAFEAAGVAATLQPFFNDMPKRLADAHLVLSRSGASTVAELGAAGRPALLVPYPHAIDDHQTANARAVERAGGGWVIGQDTFDPATLADRLARLMDDPAALAKAAAAARAAARIDAAERLADLVARLAPTDGRPRSPHTDTPREAA
jgi:UDP-N-acetylglucosamine--N-acetylmuramyl-(pentapeptide) pyrophosphoryl-undecaprenol N-acetylglucosamine transferase